jgi:iron complex outermembrane receptor protein
LNHPTNVLSAYLQDEYQVTPTVALTGSLRYDRYSTGQSHASPRLALVWDVTPRSTLKLLYGNAFRVPSVYEASFAARPLKPEQIDTIEASWQQKLSDGLLASVSVHQSELRNLIDETVLDSDTSNVMYQNRETARTRGIELELTARLSGAVSGYLSYADQSTVDTKRDPDETGSLNLSNSPARSAKAGFSLPLVAGTRASAEAVWETGRLTVQDTRTRAFVIGNLNLEYAPAGLPVRLSLRIRNIFNSQWATPGGLEHLQAEIPQNGRNATMRLEYRF